VELAFRRLANRLRGAGAAVLSVLFLCFAAPVAKAQDDVEASPKQTIESVKSHEDFKVHKVQVRQPKPSSSSSSGSSMNLGWLADLGTALAYTIIGAVVAFIIWMIWRYRHVWNRKNTGGSDKKLAPAARVVMGMDVAPESLPKDIPAAAMELWRVGRRQEALGLLYRGAISRLIEGNNVEIAESDTESDCMRRVTAEAATHAPYFRGLTDAWMLIAYGRVAPRDEAMTELCQRWPFPERRSA
jgi:hypothetical protein